MTHLHHVQTRQEDATRLVFTGILHPNVERGSGPADGIIRASYDDTEAYYNDPAVRPNDQDLHNWNYLRGKPVWFEHGFKYDEKGKKYRDPINVGQFLDSTVTRNNELFVVGEIDKRIPEGKWLAQKINEGQVGDLSIGYHVHTWGNRGDRVRSKTFNEGSIVWKGYLPKTKIAIAASKAQHYKSSDAVPTDYRIVIMASEATAQPTPAQGIQSQPSGQPPAHAQGAGQSAPAQVQPAPTQGAGQTPVRDEAMSQVQQLELETRLQKELAEKEQMAAKLKALEDAQKAKDDDYARLKKAEEERLEKIRKERLAAMENTLANVSSGFGLSQEDEEMKSLTDLNKQLALQNNPNAVAASNAMHKIGAKVVEMNTKLSDAEKATAEKDQRIAELMKELEEARNGRSIMASRVNQARQNLKSTSQSHQSAKVGNLADEQQQQQQSVTASQHMHGGRVEDILVPLPVVQHNTWEAKFIQDQYNENFGSHGGGSYGVHASASAQAQSYNPYEGQMYKPVADHKFSWYTGNGMKDQGPEGRAQFTHLVGFTDQLNNLPKHAKYTFSVGEREEVKTYDGQC